jgi:hypothetical protein
MPLEHHSITRRNSQLSRDRSVLSPVSFHMQKGDICMQDTNMNISLPDGLALIETAAGTWYAGHAPCSDAPNSVLLLGPSAFPVALEHEPLDPRQGFPCREEAIDAYCAWHEEAILPLEWEKLAAQTELYPERNAWYLDEIFHLSGDLPRVACIGKFAIAQVIVEHDGALKAISTGEPSPDEAIEQLYQKVYAWWHVREQETRQACAS